MSGGKNVRHSLGAAHSEDFVILACTVLIQLTSVTDGQTDRRPDYGKDARSILLSRVKRLNDVTSTWVCKGSQFVVLSHSVLVK